VFGPRTRPVRYLTAAEKAQELTTWLVACADMPCDVSAWSDERGFPDPPMIPWCEKINRLEGICTVQSCGGHRRTDGSIVSGHLWLRLSREVSERFDQTALGFAAQPGIEQVSRLYAPWGAEVAAVVFAAGDRTRLNRSMRVVLRYLRGIATSGRCRSIPSPGTRCRVRQTSVSCS